MASTFRSDRLAAIAAAEEHHPWFVARRHLVGGLVARHRGDAVEGGAPGCVVDVGCGTGRTLAAVARTRDRAIGIDLLAGQSHRVAGTGDLVEADACALPLDDDVADVVLALDVLEHVQRDATAAAELARVVSPRGVVVVTVPAHPWLWSHRDEDAGHERRYTRAAAVGLLSGAGLRIQQVSWFAGSTLPALALLRLLGQRSPRLRDLEERPAAGPVGRLLRRVLLAEARSVVRGTGPPVGSSIVVVARGG